MIVLVESHAKSRASRQQHPADPAAGARWGKASEFRFDQSAADAEDEDRGGVTLKWPEERIETVVVTNFSPVWRKYDIVRIRSSENPDQTGLATVTTEMLIPIGSSRQNYVGGGVGYVVDPGNFGSEERVIHSFLRLKVPSPVPDAELVSTGEEGAWPGYPEEMFPPGKFVPVFPLPGAWDR